MKKLNIVLVQPPKHPDSFTFGFLQPYALEVLATALLDHPTLSPWVNVDILDLRFKGFDALKKTILSSPPDILGITGISVDVPQMLETAKIVKKLVPSTLVVLGGHHATMCPEDLFQESVDLIVRGYGHKVFTQIVDIVLSGSSDFHSLKGVITRDGVKFTECPGWKDNLIDAPPRPRTGLLKARYKFWGKHKSVVTTAQGCGSRCTFCACWPAVGGKYITKNPEDVVEEIDQTRESHIFLGDDNTFGDIERAWAIARLLDQKGIRKNFDGYCRADIIADHPDLFELWAKIGLKRLTVGFESITNQGLESVNKGSTVETNEVANDILKRFGIINCAHILINPNFTKEDFDQIYDYILKLDIIEPIFPIYTPLPGTVFWKQIKKDLPAIPLQYFDLAHPLLDTALSIESFYKEYMKLYTRCYYYALRKWPLSAMKKTMNRLKVTNFTENEMVRPEFPALVAASVSGLQFSKDKIQLFSAHMTN